MAVLETGRPAGAFPGGIIDGESETVPGIPRIEATWPRDLPVVGPWRENGRRCTKTIGSKDDAAELATLKEAELLSKAKGINTQKRWADFVEEYLQTRRKPAASGRPRLTLSTGL